MVYLKSNVLSKKKKIDSRDYMYHYAKGENKYKRLINDCLE